MRRRPTECGHHHQHTNEVDAPSETARKRRCECGGFHVWVEPAPKRELCKTCGQVVVPRP
jgi:hypothetical protein